MVFGLGAPGRSLDAEPGQVVAQARKWTLVQKPREIVRAVRQKLAATEPNEEIEMLALDALPRCAPGGFGKRGMGNAEWTRVTAKFGKPTE